MGIDLADYKRKAEDAIKAFWGKTAKRPVGSKLKAAKPTKGNGRVSLLEKT